MIEYIIAHSPDDRVLTRASEILKNGGLVCLPTDTNWTLLASVSKKEAMDKLYKIKKENKQKHFSILCADISQASDVALIDNQAFRILKKCIPGHYTFIFEATKKISKLIQASKTDKEIGIRFIPSILVEKLLETHQEPLLSTNIPLSLFSDEEIENGIFSYMLEDKIANICEMIIDPGEFEFVPPSTIVDFMDDVPNIIREGSGDISYF